jgi:hypothetical protein
VPPSWRSRRSTLSTAPKRAEEPRSRRPPFPRVVLVRLRRVVDQRACEVARLDQVVERADQAPDLAGAVLVAAVEAGQRVEDEPVGAEVLDEPADRLKPVRAVEPDAAMGDREERVQRRRGGPRA